MGLLPVFVSTNNTIKRKKKKTKKQEELDKAHAKFLKKMGYTGTVVQRSKRVVHNRVVADSNTTKLSNQIPVGVAAKQKPNVYSGERTLLGIATMHKSNSVPVFSQEDAESISKMRR